ncbi:hypothetical protein Tco_1062271, partial [Tanacetum coccineum]
FGRHLEEMHVAWTQFGKKQDKIATLHEDDQVWHTVRGDGVTVSCDDDKELEEEFEEEFEEEDDDLEYFDTFPTREELELNYYWIMRGMVLGKPFVNEYGLVYDKDRGTIMFEKDNERKTYRMPHKMERFNNIEDLNTDNIPPFIIASNDDEENNGGFVNRHSRKAHLLEDKQIPSVGVVDGVSFYTLFRAFGRHLEEIHVTWTQFGKKRDKIATLHEDDQVLAYNS